MLLDGNKIESQDINFTLLSNNNSNNNRHKYLYDNYSIITELIDNKLCIIIEEKSDLNSEMKKYEKLYSQEELIEINKVFSIFDKIEDSFNILELNNNNFEISLENNFCVLTIKLDAKELPKNKISDSIIFNIPLINKDNNNNNLNDNKNKLNKNNNNMKSLNIELIPNDNKNNNCLDNNINNINIYSLVHNLISKVNQLTEENKEIKSRLSVLEKNNNELINIIKENRINLLKERNNIDSPSTNISNNNKKNEENQNNQNNFELNNFFLSQNNLKLDDLEKENSPNFFTRIHKRFLKEKTKNKNKDDIFEKDFKQNQMDIENHEEKNKINLILKKNKKNDESSAEKEKEKEKQEEEEENYLFTNKTETENEIYDDMNLFKNNWVKKKVENTNKYSGEKFQMNKNIICIDEKEEEKKGKFNYNLKNKDQDVWPINKDNNLIGAAYLSIKNSENDYSSFSSNQLNLKKNDFKSRKDFLF